MPRTTRAQERSPFVLPAPSSPLAGGVPSGTASTQPVTLTLETVVRRALQHNLAVIGSERRVDHAVGARQAALAALLPAVEGSITETRRTTNLEAFGFPISRVFPGGSGIPSVVGPFNVFDARVSVRQAVVDLTAVNNARADAHGLSAARETARSARETVILAAGVTYLDALAAEARVAAARAQLDTAEALLREAQDLKGAGIVAGIDVVRADVRVAAERQATTVARHVAEKTKLQLARLIGLPVGQAFVLAEGLPTIALPQASFDEVLEQAYRTRPELLAAQARVRAAESRVQATRGERLPTVSVFGDYGAIGLTPSRALSTFSVTGAMRMSLFDGGRIQGKLAEERAELAQRRSELEDVRAGVYYATKNAFLDLESAQERLNVATQARTLADLQLTQTRDRFAAGVTNNIEVVQAQEAVAAAAERHIAALHDFNVAKALVLSSPGSLEQALDRVFGTQATQGSAGR